MARLLNQPLAAFVEVPFAGPVPPEVAAFVARVATLAFTTASVAPPGATARALAANSPQGLLGAFAELLTAGGHPATRDPVADAFLRGRVALATALEASGGVWRADEAQRHLRVSRTTLLQWREGRRVLAVPVGDSFVYPVAQFEPPATDLEPPRAYPAIADVLAAAADHLTAGELAGLLATPQPGLAVDDGPPRTGFAAIADGDGPLVVSMVRHVVASPDADAHDDAQGDAQGDAPPSAPAAGTAADAARAPAGRSSSSRARSARR